MPAVDQIERPGGAIDGDEVVSGLEWLTRQSDGKMMAAPVTIGASFDAGTPVPLFQATPRQPVSSTDLFVYDVSRDGRRFLIITPVKQAEAAPMSVVLNWPAKAEQMTLANSQCSHGVARQIL